MTSTHKLNQNAEGRVTVVDRLNSRVISGVPIHRVNQPRVLVVDQGGGAYAATATNFVNQGLFYSNSNAVDIAITLPTQAAIVAAIPNCVIGDNFDVIFANDSAHTWNYIFARFSGNLTVPPNTVSTLHVTVLKTTSGLEEVQIVNQTVAPGAGVVGDFADFFALMPGDNAATIAVGAPVLFPQNGITLGTSITRLTTSTFQLGPIGTYRFDWQVSVTEPGQLMVKIGAAEQPNSVTGRATGTSQISGTHILTTSVLNSVASLVNPSGNAAALTITPTAGGTHAVSAHFVITRLA